MKGLFFRLLVFSFVFTVFQSNVAFTQVGIEFPIEVGPDSCFATSFAYDNSKYMVVMRKEKGLNSADIVVQFHSKIDHSLIGSPIVLGSTSVPAYDFDYALPQASFDGTRFLVVWTDGGIKYRFIHAQTFELSQIYSNPTLPVILHGITGLHYNPNTNKYLLVSGIKVQLDDIYLIYNFIQPNGYITNSSPLVNFPTRKEVSISYGNGKYLVCFIKKDRQLLDPVVYGQFINEDGTLSGSPFVVDDTQYPSDNPIYVIFNGSYFICFFPEEEHTGWKIYARKISPNGSVSPERYLITQDGWLIPYATIGDGKIFVTWIKPPVIYPFTTGYMKGKFFNLDMNSLSGEFVVFHALNGKVPLGNAIIWGDDKFFVYTNRVNFFIAPDSTIYFTNGDVYGVNVLGPSKVEDVESIPTDFILYQNFPNPFNPSTVIKFNIIEKGRTVLKIYDLLGNEIATLLDKNLEAGINTVRFDADLIRLKAGVYFYELRMNNFRQAKKMIYLR